MTLGRGVFGLVFLPVFLAAGSGLARTAADGSDAVAAGGGGDEASDRLVIRGFGDWVAGLSEKGRSYSIANDQLDARNLDLALNFTAFPVEGIVIHVQPFFDVVNGEPETALDFGFVSWEISDRFRLHAGKVQQPVGLFSQIFDVGTLRPFATLAQSVYGPTGVMSEGYYGVGVSGSLASDGGWGLAYDVYGGELNVSFDQMVEEVARAAGGPVVSEAAEGALNRMFGGRLVLLTPVPGLQIAAAAYSGNSDTGDEARRSVAGGSIEWLSSRVELRAEYFALLGDVTEHTGYVEAAFRPIPALQLAARYDAVLMTDVGGVSMPSGYKRHGEAALGIGWWFGRSAVFKLSGHRVDGGRLAHGSVEDIQRNFAAGTSPKPLYYAAVAASFSF